MRLFEALSFIVAFTKLNGLPTAGFETFSFLQHNRKQNTKTDAAEFIIIGLIFIITDYFK
jgi:hypothetical protein